MFFFEDESDSIVYSVAKGKIVALGQVPDEVFSQKMMGDGFAIDLESGKICAPVSGEIVAVFPSGHAYGIRTKQGIEILIHIGMDTAKLNGEGFDIKVKKGQKVKAGDLLCEVDIKAIEGKVPSLITPVIITSGESFRFLMSGDVGDVKEGDKVIEIIQE